MRVLIACEFSGIVRDAFIKRGHDAVSCDLLPSERPGPHIQGDVLKHLNDGWDMMIAHPPCTYLTLAGNRWMQPKYKQMYPTREKDRREAIEFFLALYNANISMKALENPIGIMSRVLKRPSQIIQPYHFGDMVRKPTCLWLINLPPLFATKIVAPKLHTDKNGHTDSDFHYYSFNLPKGERSKYRSRTFQGIADAMAEQWGNLPCDSGAR